MSRNRIAVVVLSVLFLFSAAVTISAQESDSPAPKGWPTEMKTVRYPSPVDQSRQPAIVYQPKVDKPVPLLVLLHTWSGTYRQPHPTLAKWCLEKDWALVAPDFRGKNETPQACGSELAVADIVAAVEYMKKRTRIDEERIYLIGRSGGGYASLLMAGRHPELWAGVSAWVPICDLKLWYAETSARNLAYPAMLEKCCGGKPGASEAVDEQYRVRSSGTWLHAAGSVSLDINHGIKDRTVPVSHSIRAFNILAEPAAKLSDEDISYFHDQRRVPKKLRNEKEDDPLFGEVPVLFRRISGNTRLTIFDGAHQAVDAAALHWLSLQRKGKPVDWSVADSATGSTGVEEVGR